MRKKLKHKKIKRNLLMFGAGFAILFLSLIIVFLSSFRIPDFNALQDRKVVNSTKIYDRTGEILLYDIHQDVKRTSIPFDEMGSNIKNATVAVEDSNFYNHKGIKITAIIRAVISNTFNLGKTQGGSTITQQ
jgi:penicillin-binding protein 1A